MANIRAATRPLLSRRARARNSLALRSSRIGNAAGIRSSPPQWGNRITDRPPWEALPVSHRFRALVSVPTSCCGISAAGSRGSRARLGCTCTSRPSIERSAPTHCGPRRCRPTGCGMRLAGRGAGGQPGPTSNNKRKLRNAFHLYRDK